MTTEKDGRLLPGIEADIGPDIGPDIGEDVLLVPRSRKEGEGIRDVAENANCGQVHPVRNSVGNDM
jgi:hypothetical protein